MKSQSVAAHLAAALFLVSVCPSAGQLIGEFDTNALKEAAEKEKDSKLQNILQPCFTSI